MRPAVPEPGDLATAAWLAEVVDYIGAGWRFVPNPAGGGIVSRTPWPSGTTRDLELTEVPANDPTIRALVIGAMVRETTTSSATLSVKTADGVDCGMVGTTGVASRGAGSPAFMVPPGGVNRRSVKVTGSTSTTATWWLWVQGWWVAESDEPLALVDELVVDADVDDAGVLSGVSMGLRSWGVERGAGGIPSSGTGAFYVAESTEALAQVIGPPLLVTPGERIGLRARCAVPAAAFLRPAYYRADGSWLTTDGTSPSPVVNPTAWTSRSVAFTVPADAAQARAVLQVGGMGWLGVDRLTIGRVATPAPIASERVPIDPGPGDELVVDWAADLLALAGRSWRYHPLALVNGPLWNAAGTFDWDVSALLPADANVVAAAVLLRIRAADANDRALELQDADGSFGGIVWSTGVAGRYATTGPWPVRLGGGRIVRAKLNGSVSDGIAQLVGYWTCDAELDA